MMKKVIFIILTLIVEVLSIIHGSSIGSSIEVPKVEPKISFETLPINQSVVELNRNATSRNGNALRIGVMTWNLAEKCLKEGDCLFLKDFYDCDMIALGIQECEDIRPRRNEGHRSRKWKEIQKHIFGKKYKLISSHKFGGMQLAILGNRKSRELVDGVQVIDVACGVGNLLSNKGGICILLRMKGKTFAFLNAHLAAHQTKVQKRNNDFNRILSSIQTKAYRKWKLRLPAIFKRESIKLKKDFHPIKTIQGGRRKVPSAIKSSKKEKTITKKIPRFDELFNAGIFLGDLNYRVNLPRNKMLQFCKSCEKYVKQSSTVPTKTKKGGKHSLPNPTRLTFGINETHPHYPKFLSQLSKILQHDQLKHVVEANTAFSGFLEANITFPPTYKYNPFSTAFDSSPKARCPAWTDRILWFQKEQGMLEYEDYYSMDIRSSSDHRPVCGKFVLNLFPSSPGSSNRS